ncbi:unnamed protein product, partial [Rotaria magnacalcarata]
QQGQISPSLPNDPEAAAKFLQQAMQNVMEPLITRQTLQNKNKTEDDNDDDDEQTDNVRESETSVVIKEETNEHKL